MFQAAKLNSAKQQALQELEEAARRFESEKAALEGRRVEQVSALEARNAELDAQVRPPRRERGYRGGLTKRFKRPWICR